MEDLDIRVEGLKFNSLGGVKVNDPLPSSHCPNVGITHGPPLNLTTPQPLNPLNPKP